MEWKFREDIPLYRQIIDGIKLRIATGDWLPGEKVPSVRELAMEAGVNPNTMQRALADLERDGLLHTKRTAGRFVTEERGCIQKLQERLADEYVDEFLVKMTCLGYTPEKATEFIQKRRVEDGD